jgi:hypothetical protein
MLVRSLTSVKEVEARYWNKRKRNTMDRRWVESRSKCCQGLSGDYLFDMGDNLYIDGEDADVSSWCRFILTISPRTLPLVISRQDVLE